MSVPRENAVVRCKTLRILRESNAFELISDARDAFRKTVSLRSFRRQEAEREREKDTQRETHPHSFFASDFIAKGSEKSEGTRYILEEFFWLQFCLSFVA